MILYELRCESDHRFEAWFRNAAAFDEQQAAQRIECPVCGDHSVGKAPMAPRIAKARSTGEGQPMTTKLSEVRRELEALRRRIEETSENVGDRFADEARKIHYGEAETRDIYGTATDDEASSLEEEGVPFARIPWVKRTDG